MRRFVIRDIAYTLLCRGIINPYRTSKLTQIQNKPTHAFIRKLLTTKLHYQYYKNIY